MEEVKYNRIVKSLAMSKGPNQNGIIFDVIDKQWGYDENRNYKNLDIEPVIKINATNPKTGTTSYLEMQIPVENLQDVINALRKIKSEIDAKKVSSTV